MNFNQQPNQQDFSDVSDPFKESVFNKIDEQVNPEDFKEVTPKPQMKKNV